jgi:DNA-binding NarL/FixJ family response regulator
VLITDNSVDVMRELSVNKLDRFVVFSKLTPFYRLTEILREGLISGGFHAPIPTVSPTQIQPRHVAHSSIGVGGDRKPLTVKQVEVLEYICSGMSNKEIADTMHISAETVKGHVKDILDRLQVKNRMEAAAFYRQARRQNYYASH